MVWLASERASWRDFIAGRMLMINVLSLLSTTSFPTEIRVTAVSGRNGKMFWESQACAPGSVEREGMAAFATVTVTEIPVPAKARRMSVLASKILT